MASFSSGRSHGGFAEVAAVGGPPRRRHRCGASHATAMPECAARHRGDGACGEPCVHGTFVDLFDLFERHRIGARCMRSAAPIVSVSSPRSLALSSNADVLTVDGRDSPPPAIRRAHRRSTLGRRTPTDPRRQAPARPHRPRSQRRDLGKTVTTTADKPAAPTVPRLPNPRTSD